MAYRSSSILDKIFSGVSTFILNGAYVYIFLASLMIFRLLFHYSRWVWPLVEYKSARNKSVKHQVILGAITLGLLTTLIVDLIKLIF